MKKTLPLIFSLLLLSIFCNNGFSQTQYWSDTFEDAGAPSSGSRTPSVQFYATTERYYNRVTTAQVNTTTTYSGFQGTKFWGGADVDNITGQNTQSPQQNITWSSINISGQTSMSFRGLFAIGNIANFDHFPGSSPIDYMLVEYRIDGGAWTNLVRFFPNIANSGAGALALETTGDSLAAGEGQALNGTFAEFTANISGTGSLLDLRFKSGNNGTSFEEIAADNFRLFSGGTLPISLIDFSGDKRTGSNVLNWTTASEQDNKHFEIERSTNGIAFDKIGVITGNGTTSSIQHYTFLDSTPSFQKLYYRLKQVDLHDRFQYSKIIVLNNSTPYGISIFPNPVTDLVTLQMGSNQLTGTTATLTDMNGKVISVTQISSAVETINMKQLPAGLYMLRLADGTVHKLIKK